MKSTLQFEDKKVLVLGLAKSGYAVAKLLNSLGLTSLSMIHLLREGNKEAAELRAENISVICGRPSNRYFGRRI